jgi:ankyrin repeat protein
MKIKLLILCAVAACALSSAFAQTPTLFAAARTNDVNMTKSLLESNVDVNQQDDKGYTPLMLATYDDNFEVATLLLKQGAKTEVTDHSGRTALMGAAFKGNDREVKLLLDNGANPAATDSKGLTSMMYAVMFGRLSVIRTLRAGKPAPSSNGQ